MALVRCKHSDLPERHQKHLLNLVRTLYDSMVDTSDDISDQDNMDLGSSTITKFVSAIKSTLDDTYRPHWHVLLGKSLGFACKKRNRTVGVWHIVGGKKLGSANMLMLVIWKSPAIELPSLDTAKDDEVQKTSTQDAKETCSSFKVVLPDKMKTPLPLEIESVVSILREACCHNAGKSSAELAKVVRSQLTKQHGTIWHVVVGSDFVIQHAVDARNYALASFHQCGKDMKIACFQHEQSEAIQIDWQKLLQSLPYLMVVLACFAYMGVQNVCSTGTSSTASFASFNVFARIVQNRVCVRPDWESEVGYAAMAIVTCSFMTKRMFKGGENFPRT